MNFMNFSEDKMQGKLFLKPKYETFMLPTVAVATVILMQIQLPFIQQPCETRDMVKLVSLLNKIISLFNFNHTDRS